MSGHHGKPSTMAARSRTEAHIPSTSVENPSPLELHAVGRFLAYQRNADPELQNKQIPTILSNLETRWACAGPWAVWVSELACVFSVCPVLGTKCPAVITIDHQQMAL